MRDKKIEVERHPAGDPRLHLGGGPHLSLGAPPGRLPDWGAEPPLALRVPVRPGDGGNAGLLLQPYLIPRLSRHFGKGGRGVCQLWGAPRLPAGHRGLPAVHLWDDAHVFFLPDVRQALSKHHRSRDPLPGARGPFSQALSRKTGRFYSCSRSLKNSAPGRRTMSSTPSSWCAASGGPY